MPALLSRKEVQEILEKTERESREDLAESHKTFEDTRKKAEVLFRVSP